MVKGRNIFKGRKFYIINSKDDFLLFCPFPVKLPLLKVALILHTREKPRGVASIKYRGWT